MPAVLEASLQARGGAAREPAGGRSGMSGLSRPVQVVLARVAVPWRLIDLSELDAAEQRAAAGGASSQPTGWSGSIWRRRRCCGLR